MMQTTTKTNASQTSPWDNHPAYKIWIKEFFQALFDLDFHQSVTVKMLPLLYIVGIIGAGLLTLFVVVQAFSENFWVGIACLVFAAPIIFTFCTAALRSLLEFFSVVFRIQYHIQGLQNNMGALHQELQQIQKEMHSLAEAVDSVDVRAGAIAKTVEDATTLFRDFDITGKIPFFSKPKKTPKEKNWAEAPLPETYQSTSNDTLVDQGLAGQTDTSSISVFERAGLHSQK